MPTANSAAPAQPIQRSMSRYRRLVPKALGVLVGLALLAPTQAVAPQSVNAAASPACSGWNSTTRPPDWIRVLRVRTGRIESVEFRKYVVTVMGKEWPSYLPQAVVEAGAVAVKQYAWFHAMNPRRTNMAAASTSAIAPATSSTSRPRLGFDPTTTALPTRPGASI